MRRTRFSIYCLEDGDEYFGDSLADMFYVTSGKSGTQGRTASKASLLESSGRQKLRGKLRLSGRALFFDADDWSRPLLMFKFKDVCRSDEKDLELLTEEDAVAKALGKPPQRASSTGTFLAFRCGTVHTQLVGGDVDVHGQETTSHVHVIGFPFGNAVDLVEKINSLLNVERVADGLSKKLMLLTTMVEQKEAQSPFSLTDLSSHDETIIKHGPCVRILPLAMQRGRIVVSSKSVYFKPTFPIVTPGIEIVECAEIRRVERRHLQFQDVGLEIATFRDVVLLFSFPDAASRNEVFSAIGSHPGVVERLAVNDVSKMMHKWIHGRISTFDYLMYLNWVGGRSLNDLAQYPVLPWVLCDYASSSIDLNDPKVFRDLSKPIGALTESRLKTFQRRADDLRSIGESPYLYASHYSNPAYVTFFKVRTHPEYMLVLHSGKLDHAARMFESIQDTFAGVLTGPMDLKELIPEFFYGEGEILKRGKQDLGTKGDGTKVRREVILPPWADSPESFIRINREALESANASSNMHHWIDLIFGFRQQGHAAWQANNVFHPLSYESGIGNINDRNARAAAALHAKEFGQCPRQLFTKPHPLRECGATPKHVISLTTFTPPDSDELIDASPRSDAKGNGASKHHAVAAFVSQQKQQQPQNTVAGEDDSSDDERPAAKPLQPLLTLKGTRKPQQEDQEVVEALDISHVVGDADPAESDQPHNPVAESTLSSKGAAGRKLPFMTCLKITAKGRIDNVVICSIPADAHWMIDEREGGDRVPVIFASDSSGMVAVFDVLSEKRVRNLEFRKSTVSAMCSTAADRELLVALASGSFVVMNLSSCAVDEEYDLDANISVVAARQKIVALGTRDGGVEVWKCLSDSPLKLPRDPHLTISCSSKIVAIDVDHAAKRVLACDAEGSVEIIPVDGSDTLSFELPNGIAKTLSLSAFVKDHLVIAISRFEIRIMTLDGNVWASFPTPIEVVFAELSKGGSLAVDTAVLSSPEGCVAVVNCTNGTVVARGQIDVGVLSGATICCGSVGTECLALGDTAGKIHVFTLADN